MKIIRITTGNEISVHNFPEGDYCAQNNVLRELIGLGCELYEHVMPDRLYTELGGSDKAGEEMGNCVSMLVDEEGLYHGLEDNIVGSYLYGADQHGHKIAGNILIVGEVLGGDGIDFCGISDNQFTLLYPKLEELTKKARDFA